MDLDLLKEKLLLIGQFGKLSTFSFSHNMAYYECDKRGRIRLVSLMNLMQDAAQTHVAKQGFSTVSMAKISRAWMANKYAIRIKKYPKAGEKIEVSTWVSEISKITAVREFLISDTKGNVLVEAISKWVLVDVVRKKVVELPTVSLRTKTLFKSNFAQAVVKREDCKKKFTVYYDNIDFNQHVNNSFYPLWASETVSRDFRTTHSPEEIIISFKHEALYGEEIEVKTQIDGQVTNHSIISGEGKECARVTIKWQSNAST